MALAPHVDISVVIPTFNRAHLIERALKSVLSQTGASFEILVIDDGSTDGTRDLVREIASAHPEIRYFSVLYAGLPAEQSGPSRARNIGIQNACSPFVAFLDSDDEWLPGKLARQTQFFKQNPDYLICQTEEIWIRRGRRVNPMKKHKKRGGFIFERSLALSLISPSSVMMRKEFFDEVGLFDESLPACEDYDLWLRASSRMPIGLIETPYVRRWGGHSDQQSQKYPVMDKFRIEALLKILRSGVLTKEQTNLVKQELIRKCSIVYSGAKKRGNLDLIRFCEEAVKETGGSLLLPPVSKSLS